MAKVTSKLQVTLPKALARQYRIEPGDDILWVAAGDAIRVIPAKQGTSAGATRDEKLAWFDRATQRQRARDAKRTKGTTTSRGWQREELYDRGRPR